MSATKIVALENYITMFNAPQAEEARRVIAKAEIGVDSVITTIQGSWAVPTPCYRFYDRFTSKPVKPIFHPPSL